MQKKEQYLRKIIKEEAEKILKETYTDYGRDIGFSDSNDAFKHLLTVIIENTEDILTPDNGLDGIGELYITSTPDFNRKIIYVDEFDGDTTRKKYIKELKNQIENYYKNGQDWNIGDYKKNIEELRKWRIQ